MGCAAAVDTFADEPHAIPSVIRLVPEPSMPATSAGTPFRCATPRAPPLGHIPDAPACAGAAPRARSTCARLRIRIAAADSQESARPVAPTRTRDRKGGGGPAEAE